MLHQKLGLFSFGIMRDCELVDPEGAKVHRPSPRDLKYFLDHLRLIPENGQSQPIRGASGLCNWPTHSLQLEEFTMFQKSKMGYVNSDDQTVKAVQKPQSE